MWALPGQTSSLADGPARTLRSAVGAFAAPSNRDAGSRALALRSLRKVDQDAFELFLVDRLVFEKRVGDRVEIRTLLGKDLERLVVRAVDQARDFGIDFVGNLRRVVGMRSEI